MSSEKSYREIFKATSIFGGVQVFIILLGIVRTKVIAIIIGAAGVGLMGLLLNFVNVINAISGLGIQYSSVRFIAELKSKQDQIIVSKVIRILALFSAILGMVLSILFSKEIAQVLFKDTGKANFIIILSLAVFFFTLEGTELAILQGYRKIKTLAKARVLSGIFALIITLPIYYFYKLEGIAYSVALIYLINFITILFFSDYKSNFKVRINFDVFIIKSKSILNLGVAFAISSVLTLASAFLIKTYISNSDSLTELGFYEAGYVLVNSYAGLIFIAMAKDYYPRLSKYNTDNKKLELMSNQQIEIGMLIILPMLVFIIVFMDLIIKILYTKDFVVVKDYLYFALTGIVFKLISWSQSYIILAKGKSKIFIVYEIIGSLIFFTAHIFGYKYMGLRGLGMAYLIHNIIYFIIIYLINIYFFNIKLMKVNWLLCLSIISISASLVIFNYKEHNEFLKHAINSLAILLVTSYSLFMLNKKVDFASLIKGKN